MTTWEDAAIAAGRQLLGAADGWDLGELSEPWLNEDIEEALQHDLIRLYEEVWENDVLICGRLLHTYLSMGVTALIGVTGGQAMSTQMFRTIVPLIVYKQSRYGHDNIGAFEHVGLLVRLTDKVARYSKMTREGIEDVAESVEDSLLDIIGYCLIGTMLIDGTFYLPLGDHHV